MTNHGNPIGENICPNCGQPAKLKRIDNHYISHELLHLFHFEKGFLYTAKELLLRPGKNIREFIDENRNRHMKPLTFLILSSLLYTLIAHLTHADKINNEKVMFSFGNSSVDGILSWTKTNVGYSNIIMGVFIALLVKLLFGKYKYNFFEILILLCFVMGQSMVLFAAEALFVGVLSKQLYMTINLFVGFAYPTWAIGQFFDQAKMGSYVKGGLAYFLGTALYILAIIPVGLAADFVLKLL